MRYSEPVSESTFGVLFSLAISDLIQSFHSTERPTTFVALSFRMNVSVFQFESSLLAVSSSVSGDRDGSDIEFSI
jgi:hypothetical protein